MSRLVLVRHAQASLYGDGGYDRLSELGERQAAVLGAHLVDSRAQVDRVYFGPKLRQRQTAEAVGAVFGERGARWPEPVEMPALDEHQSNRVIKTVLPAMAERDPSLEPGLAAMVSPTPEQLGEYFRIYRKLSTLWVEGALDLEGSGIEDWPDFRARVDSGLETMLASADGGSTTLAFTSAGPVAVAVGRMLGLDDRKTMEVSWVVRNASSTEILFTQGRRSLQTFNADSYLEAAGLATYI